MNTVLVPFPFAGDGFTVEWLTPGDVRDFGAAAKGLAAAGLISEAAVSDGDAPPPASEPDAEPPKKRGRPARS